MRALLNKTVLPLGIIILCASVFLYFTTTLQAENEKEPVDISQILFEQVNWNAYRFSAQGADGVEYRWETSDGRAQEGAEATFHFAKTGDYQVKLVTMYPNGILTNKEVTVHVSFFHLRNPWLASMIVGLLVLCGAILWKGMRNPHTA